MVREICRDPAILAIKAADATPQDLNVAEDLLDTLAAHRENCLGMAANMIGISKRIIAFNDLGVLKVMLNPRIIQKSGAYVAQESCLSISGMRFVKRWRSIRIQYQNKNFQVQTGTFTDLAAQIIQHELDHCEGILI